MIEHPNAIRLEAFACGEAAPGVAAHVSECAACRAFVERARDAADDAPPVDLARAAASARTHERSRRFAFASYAGVTLAAAAALLLWIGRPLAPPPPSDAPPWPAVAAPLIAEGSEPDTTFKGGVQVAVIRERDGAQTRFTQTVRVRPGDRLRIEVAVDRPQSLVGAVLGDDGTYVEMMLDGVRGAGTHFSEKAARVDARPLQGTVVVGPPDAVQRARATGKLTGVAAIRVEWEATP